MTEKFEKELNKFFEWAKNKNIVVKNKSGEQIEWKKDMIEFVEPSRNKMETFVKMVIAEYTVIDENGNLMDDNKIIVVKYKLEKPKKKYNKKKVESEDSDENSEIQQIEETKPVEDTKSVEETKPIEIVEKKERKTRKKNVESEKEESEKPKKSAPRKKATKKSEIDELTSQIESLTTKVEEQISNIESDSDSNKPVEVIVEKNVESANLSYKINLEDILCN